KGVITPRRLPRPVISVGNLAAGGTGKTPFVRLLAAELKKRGTRVAILSRGYGAPAAARPPRLVTDGAMVFLTAAEAGDEPAMLARALDGVAIVIDPDRFRGGVFALAQLPVDIFILDDGFQHRRLEREVDILLLDATRPFGNGRLLPAGPLREPAGAVARADIIVLTRCPSQPAATLAGDLSRPGSRAPVFLSTHHPVRLIEHGPGVARDITWLKGRRIAVLSGIARPEEFARTLNDLGARVVCRRDFPDHHCFTCDELEAFSTEAARGGAEAILATAKDAVRLPETPSLPLPLLVLEIEMGIVGGTDKLIQSVLTVLESRTAHAR
ncbi:MAG: tetraacyldisaccharide 4'-kinase, partial [Candidatus Aureabacteria bacterium]|nr:tetraacyldisaccharide 4'-kinase [Candidatus Auribacterota bacterium]